MRCSVLLIVLAALVLATPALATAAVTLTPQVAPSAAGTITVTPSQASYTPSASVTIQAAANPGYAFVSWSAAGGSVTSPTSTTTSLSLTTNCTLTASFTQLQYPLTTAINPPGVGTVACSPSQAAYHYGDQLSIQAAANPGYQFSGWNSTGGALANPSAASTTLTITSSCSLTANFVPVYTLGLSTPQGAATVTPSQASYTYGSVVTIAASTVTAGYVLDHWTLTGAGTLSNSGALATTLTIRGNATVTAAYVPGYYVNNLSPTASDTNVGSLTQPFLTIGKATGLATAGQTVVVLQGLYREAPALANSGLPGSPITLKANPGDRVVVTGADPIPAPGGTWTPCTAVTASGNPNYAHLYWTDLPWYPMYLSEDETPLVWAKTPVSSWWVPTGSGTAITLVNAVNLTQTDANYWVGAGVWLWDTTAIEQYWRQVTAFDPVAHTITVDSSWHDNFAPDPSDRYYLANCLPLLSAPGQVVVAPSGSGWRVYLWPLDNDRPAGHRFDGTSRGYGLSLIGRSYWTIDGFEVCYTGSRGIGAHKQIGTDQTIRNCVVHHCVDLGINTGGSSLILNNFVFANGGEHDQGVGVSTGGSGCLVQGNEIANNTNDGIDFCSTSSAVIGNYIHHHMWWGHDDNLQFWSSNSVTNLLVQDNLLAFGGKAVMGQQGTGVAFVGNACLCNGNQMEFHSDTTSLTWNHNTMFGGGLIEMGGGNDTLLNGIYIQQEGAFWGSSSNAVYSSDYNCFWHAVATTNSQVMNWNGVYNWTLAAYAATSSQDTHSKYGPRDAGFANMAQFYVLCTFGGSSGHDFWTDRVYAANTDDLASAAVGDYIEIAYDGVPRQITQIAGHCVFFTPSAAGVAFKGGSFLDWKSNHTNLIIDLALLAGSPALGAASDGSNCGSSLDTVAYQNGDFGVYGKRPQWWPPTSANLTRWAVAATHRGALLAVTASEGRVEPRLAPTGLTLNFDYALSPATINSAALTIVSETGSDYSSRIAAVTLDATGQVLTVSLVGPLPDRHWYTFALNPAVAAANGGPVRGPKSLRLGLLAGNVTGSGRITAADVAALRSHVGQPVTPATALYDLDGNGVITPADLRLIQSLLGHSLP